MRLVMILDLVVKRGPNEASNSRTVVTGYGASETPLLGKVSTVSRARRCQTFVKLECDDVVAPRELRSREAKNARVLFSQRSYVVNECR